MKTKQILKLLIIVCLMLVILSSIPISYSLALNRTSTTANFEKANLREGGPESGNLLTDEQLPLYDTGRYRYQDVLKIVEASDGIDYSNNLYSLDMNTDGLSYETNPIGYSNKGLFDEVEPETKQLTLGIPFPTDSSDPDYEDNLGFWNYNFVCLEWLFNNFYLKNDAPEEKEAYLQKAFSEYIDNKVSEGSSFEEEFNNIKTTLTDDDIDVVQQCAVWYFSSMDFDRDFSLLEVLDDTNNPVQLSDEKILYMTTLYEYLTSNAMGYFDIYMEAVDLGEELPETVYPTIVNQNQGNAILDGEYYELGPFEVTSGDANPGEYTIKLVDQDGNEINRSDYIIKDSFGGTITDNIDEIFDSQYYVYISTTVDLSEAKLVLEYTEYETTPTLWKPTVVTDAEPIILLNRSGSTSREEQSFLIEKAGKYALKIINEDAADGTKFENVEFNIKIGDDDIGNYFTNQNGRINLDSLIIANTNTQEIIITQVNPPSVDYDSLSGTVNFYINKISEDGSIIIDSIETPSLISDATVTFNRDSQLITITIQNSKKQTGPTIEYGTYNFEIEVEDAEAGTKLPNAEFTISVGGTPLLSTDGTEVFKTNSSGKITLPTRTVSDLNNELFTIYEVNPPATYGEMNERINVVVNKADTGNKYEASGIRASTSPTGSYLVTFDDTNKLVKVSVKNERDLIVNDGSYDLEIIKQDKDTLEKLSGINFNVKLNGNLLQNTNGTNIFTTDTNGKITVPTITINSSSADTLLIEEIAPKEGYKTADPVTVTVTKKIDVDTYKIDTVSGTGANLSNDKITVTVENEKISGSYGLKIEKLDENDNIISESESTFGVTINGESEVQKTTTSGRADYGNIQIEDTTTQDTIVLREINAPEGYNKLINSVTITVTKGIQNEAYVATDVNVTGANVTAEILHGNIVVKVKNEKITGQYYLDLRNIDLDENLITSGNATFGIRVNGSQEEEVNLTNGTYLYGPISIEDTNSQDEITVTEKTSPEGYKIPGSNETKLLITKGVVNGNYKATNVELDEPNSYVDTQIVDNNVVVLVKNEKITGSYNLEIRKVDESGNTISSDEATFGVKVNSSGEETLETTNGVLDYGTIMINSRASADEIEIREINAPEGYNKLINSIKLLVTKDIDNDTYVATDAEIVGANSTAELDGNKVIVKIRNDLISGSYDFEINKVDESDNLILANANFGISVNGKSEENKQVTNGKIEYGRINIEGTAVDDTITIREINAPEGYNSLIGNVTLTIKKEVINGVYKAVQVTSSNANVTAQIENDKVIAKVKNEKITGSYDLEIRKVDDNGDVITSGVAEFKLKIKNGTEETINTTNGIINYGTINIEETSSQDEIIIREITPPNGYNKIIDSIKVKVTKEVVSGNYKATNVELEGSDAEVNIEGNKVVVKITNEKITGNYDLEIQQYDQETNTLINKESTFSVKVNSGENKNINTENGIATYGTVEIEQIDLQDVITVEEIVSPRGYKAIEGSITVNVNKKLEDGEYKVQSVTTSDENVQATVEQNKVIIKIKNEKVAGTYNLEVISVDELNNPITNVATYGVTVNNGLARDVNTINGIATYGTINIEDVSTEDEIKITETAAPEGYNKLIGEIKLKVDKVNQDEVYKVSNVTLEGENAEYILSEDKITVKIKNQKITGNYSLEIRKVDENGNIITDSESTFSIKVKDEDSEEKQTLNGVIDYGQINIEERISKDEIIIEELVAPLEYKKLINNITVKVTKDVENGSYKATSAEVLGENATATVQDNKVIVTITNARLTGNYSLEIWKVDENNNLITTGEATFGIKIKNNAEEDKQTTGGKILLGPITIDDRHDDDDIIITEKVAPSEYNKLIDSINLKVKKDIVGESYKATEVELTGENAEANIEEDKIIVKIKNEKVTGSYNLEIRKVDDNGNIIQNKEATFGIQIKDEAEEEKITTNGKIDLGEIAIEERLTKDEIQIKELTAPDGYNILNNNVKVKITKDIVDGKYEAISSEVEGANAESYVENNKVIVNIKNERITGNYKLEIWKVDEDGAIIENQAKFSVKVNEEEAKEIEAQAGKAEYGTIEITDEKENDIIKLEETKAPELFKKLIGTVNLEVTKKVENGKYKISGVTSDNENVTVNIENDKIIAKVKNEKILGSYNLELTKVDSKNEEIKLSGVAFEIKLGETDIRTVTTDENGIINLQDISIKSDGAEELVITETNAKEGYELLENPIKLEISKELMGEEYKVTSVHITENNEMSDVTLEDNKTIKLKVQNEKIILGSYDFIIETVNEEDEIIGDAVTFDINEESKQTEGGTIKYENIEINKKNVDTPDKYGIKESSVPEIYSELNSTILIKLNKRLSDDETKYQIDSEELSVIDENGVYYDTDDVKSEIIEADGKQIVKLTIRNYREVDFSLKNNLVAISKDENFEENEFIQIQDSKEEIEVAKNDYLLYRIKINNEGISKAKATEIVDYLPDGLDFVEGIEANNIWDYDAETRKLKTNENFEAKLLNAHVDGQEDDYQEIDLICKVNENAEEDIILKIVSEIAEIRYDNDKLAKDTDSVLNNCNENQEEDDTDFVNIVVIDYTKVDLSLRVFIAGISQDETIDENDLLTGENSREPVIDKEKLDLREEKTAEYNQPKNVLNVRENNLILYKIRIYNEGNIKAKANKVKVYIPEGLEIAENIEQNEIWEYDEETNTVKTNDKYIPKLLERHTKQKDLDFQDIEIVLKVKEDVEEDVNLVLISEITEYENEDGEIIIDRDSESNNFEYPEDISEYIGRRVSNNYVAGQEDEDDFEVVMVKALFGEYDFEIEKVDQEGKIVKDFISEFNINGENRETEEGIISYNNIGISKKNVKIVDTYEITEYKAPKDFTKFEGTILVQIPKKIADDETKYEVDKENVILTVKDKDGNIVEESKDAILKVEEIEGKTKVSVQIRNYEHIDLALRKYVAAISKKDTTFDKSEYLQGVVSRVPEVNTKNLDEGKETSATYNHRKDAVEVKRFNYILFNIRVYNEGNQNGIASKITDYIPEELEFVKTAKENEIWDYDENTRIATTNDKYVPKVITKHTKGTALDFQEIGIVCKVKDEIEEDKNIVNIAEISEYKYEDGSTAVDRDSSIANFEYPQNVSEHVTSEEDDDNFDRIIVRPNTGLYDIEIMKVDDFGNVIKTGTAIFNISGQEIKSTNGVAKLSGINITKENVNEKDLFEIIEVEAPKGYIRYTGNVNLYVDKKEADDKSKLEVKSANVEFVSAYGETLDGEVQVVKGEAKDRVIIKIKNEKIPVETVNNNNTVITSNYSTTGTSTGTVSGTTSGTTVTTSKGDWTGNNTIVTKANTNTDIAKDTTNTNNTNNSNVQSNTGDKLPEKVVNIILIVILLNIIQICISKLLKKNNEE